MDEEEECDVEKEKSKEWSEKCRDLYIPGYRSCIPEHWVGLYALSWEVLILSIANEDGEAGSQHLEHSSYVQSGR